jgi:hypothetical protein
MKLDEVERNQSYPRNENDAFMLSGALFFDRDALAWYQAATRAAAPARAVRAEGDRARSSG